MLNFARYPHQSERPQQRRQNLLLYAPCVQPQGFRYGADQPAWNLAGRGHGSLVQRRSAAAGTFVPSPLGPAVKMLQGGATLDNRNSISVDFPQIRIRSLPVTFAMVFRTESDQGRQGFVFSSDGVIGDYGIQVYCQAELGLQLFVSTDLYGPMIWVADDLLADDAWQTVVIAVDDLQHVRGYARAVRLGDYGAEPFLGPLSGTTVTAGSTFMPGESYCVLGDLGAGAGGGDFSTSLFVLDQSAWPEQECLRFCSDPLALLRRRGTRPGKQCGLVLPPHWVAAGEAQSAGAAAAACQHSGGTANEVFSPGSMKGQVYGNCG